MQLCITEQHFLWPLAQASHLQVQRWLRSFTHSSCALSFSALLLLRSHRRTCLVLLLPLVSQLVAMPLVPCLVDL